MKFSMDLKAKIIINVIILHDSTFKSSKLHLIFHMYMYIVSYQCPNIFSLEWNGEAIGLNEPRPVPARQNRSRDWSNDQGIITLGGTAWIHYRSSSNDNCYITRRFGLWERQKSRGSIPEYKWHFQEHASDRVRIRRLTGSICNILSRNGSERRERR